MAAIFAYEIQEALRILREPDFYIAEEDPDIEAGKIWVGPADDTILRKRGVEFVDGSAPGFAAIVGAAPTPEIAKDIIESYAKAEFFTKLPEVDEEIEISWKTAFIKPPDSVRMLRMS